jgi:hypothetical protein
MFFNLFSKKKKVLKEGDADFTKKMASFTISVNVDNTTDLEFTWPDWTPDNQASVPLVANALASTLFTLTNGAINKELLDTLMAYKTYDTQDKRFIELTINDWVNMDNIFRETLKGSNIPVVKPSEAFKNS